MIEAVPDRLDGAPRQLRRFWSDEFKATAVEQACQPGGNVSAVARQIGILPSQLYRWRRELLGSDERPADRLSPLLAQANIANDDFRDGVRAGYKRPAKSSTCRSGTISAIGWGSVTKIMLLHPSPAWLQLAPERSRPIEHPALSQTC
nr:transposase [Rhizobium leguminosarum]